MAIHTYHLSTGTLRMETSLGYIVRHCLKDNIQITFIPTNCLPRYGTSVFIFIICLITFTHILQVLETIMRSQVTFCQEQPRNLDQPLKACLRQLTIPGVCPGFRKQPDQQQQQQQRQRNILLDPSTWMA